MDSFFTGMKALKLPTITVVGLLLFFGVDLVKSSPNDLTSLNGMLGVTLVATAILLGIIVSLDYRHKDATDSAIKTQQGVISKLNSVISSLTSSAKLNEKITQKEMTTALSDDTIGADEKRNYRLEDTDETSVT